MRPQPFTESDCDCRGLPFMPLEVTRLRDSDLVMLSTGDEFKAAVMLWSAAWLQVPAASLPDDDRILAKLSTYPLVEWLKLKKQALRGFVKCADGRLYHPIIADHAATAFLKRKGQSAKSNTRWAKERARKASKGNASADATAHATASALGMQGKGTVEVEGEEKFSEPNGSSNGGGGARDDWPEVDPVKTLLEAVASPWLDPAKSAGLSTTTGRLAAWRREGATWAGDVLPVVKRLCAERREPISTWKFFDAAIGRSVADSRAGLTIPEGGVVVSMRGLGEQIGAEKAEAKRRTLAMLEARNG